jgi:putative oxidoreductase
MKNQIFGTTENYSITIIRVVLGIIIFSHGAQYMLGWFGGYGLEATLQFLTSVMGLPWIVALAVIIIQFFGSVMLLAGAATRVAALGIFGIFIGMASFHFEFGLHMNWDGKNSGEGFEYHLLVLAMAFALMFSGGGAFSVDQILLTKQNRSNHEG